MLKKILVFVFIVAFPFVAHAGVIIKTPTSLGLSSGLVLHWTFDGTDIYGTSARDKSGSGNHGTITAPQTTSGKIGQALESGKNAVNSSVIKSSFTNISSYPITIAAWTMATGNNGSIRSAVTVGTTGDPYFGIGWASTNGTVTIADLTGGGPRKTGSVIGNNKWVHMVGVFNSATDRKLYINGVLDVSDTVAGATNPASVNEVRAMYGGGTAYMKVDDVRVYNRALSDDEISRLYNLGASSKIKTPVSPATSGLVTHWTFDGTDIYGTSAQDKSGSGNHGTITSPQIILGKFGQGLRSGLNGTGSYITKTSYSSISGYPFTLSVWSYPNGNNGSYRAALSLEVNASVGAGIGWAGNPSWVRLWGVGTELVDQVMDGPAGTVGKWSHIVGVFNSSTDRKLYVDGVLINTDTDAMTLGTPTALYVFRGSTAPMMAADDVRVYNRALSGEEVLQLYNMGNANKIKTPTSVSSGLVGHWTMDGADTYWSSVTAGTVTDKSGNNNTGTLTNMSRSSSPTIGKMGQALRFDGLDDYITIPDSASLNPSTQISISTWVKSTTDGNVVSKYNSNTSNKEYWLAIGDGTSPGVVYGMACGDGNNFNTRISSITVNDGNWHHVVMTFSAAGVVYPNIYIDGVLRNGATTGFQNITSLFNGNTPVTISSVINVAGSRTNYFNGQSDDVRIYNKVLSLEEIQTIYSAGR